MKPIFLCVALVGMGMVLTGCGTISEVTPANGKPVDFTRYERVLVLDFVDGATQKEKPANQPRKKAEMAVRTKSFPDRIAIELGAKNVFKEVTRTGEPDPQTLVISGTITRYVEGDAMGRLMIGLGVGSSYFDAIVDFKDGGTSELLATQKVDRNSWVLGGGIASTQSPDEFMKEAAQRLVYDITTAKHTGKLEERVSSPHPMGKQGQPH
jgi:hypothetical protein